MLRTDKTFASSSFSRKRVSRADQPIECKRSIHYAAAAILALSFVTVTGPARAWDQNPFDEYLQRSDTVTSEAGDAKDANEAVQTIDPWPRYSTNRFIPGHGERMSGAVERYRDVTKLPRAPKPISPVFDVQSATSGGSSGGGGAGGQ